jgi:hypothetical protein
LWFGVHRVVGIQKRASFGGFVAVFGWILFGGKRVQYGIRDRITASAMDDSFAKQMHLRIRGLIRRIIVESLIRSSKSITCHVLFGLAALPANNGIIDQDPGALMLPRSSRSQLQNNKPPYTTHAL